MAKEPLYPHIPKGQQIERLPEMDEEMRQPRRGTNVFRPNNILRKVSKITTRSDGTIIRQTIEDMGDIDETLRAYFSIFAKTITIKYDTGMEVEYALVPE